MKRTEIDTYLKIIKQLEALYIEISGLSKKASNDAINLWKLKFVNSVISGANELLNDRFKPFNEFNQFDENDIPTNSDVAMMLSQYIECMELFRRENIVSDIGTWYWKIGGKKSDIKTWRPSEK